MKFAQVAAFLEKAKRFFFVRCLFEEAYAESSKKLNVFFFVRCSFEEANSESSKKLNAFSSCDVYSRKLMQSPRKS